MPALPPVDRTTPRHNPNSLDIACRATFSFVPIAYSREPIYKGLRALELFTDRHDLSRAFAFRVQEATDEKIIYFHGDGGNGKSLLLRFLRRDGVKFVTQGDWESIKGKTGEEFVQQYKSLARGTRVPTFYWDFETGDRGPMTALLSIRRELSGKKLRFPTFDYAVAMFLKKTNQPLKETFKLPAEEMDFVSTLVDISTSGTKGALLKSVLQFAGKHTADDVTRWAMRRKLDEGTIERLNAMDPLAELLPSFPELLARDLSASIGDDGAPERVALFFDTHEAFYSTSGGTRVRDERWFRDFLRNLDLKRAIVVVGGRDYPRHWTELPPQESNIPAESIEAHLVGHLSPEDARSYLELAGVPEEFREVVVRYCSANDSEPHCLYLGMAADLFDEAKAKGEPVVVSDFDQPQPDIARTLLDRLLVYAGDSMRRAVEVLSACRSFDLELYIRLCKVETLLLPTPAEFEWLSTRSFVWTDDAGKFRIHDLIRRLHSEGGNEWTAKGHVALETIYRERASDPGIDAPIAGVRALGEAVYHLSDRDPDAALREWTGHFRDALDKSQTSQCLALLDSRPKIKALDDGGASAGSVGAALESEAEYLLKLARHGEARGALRSA